MQGGVYALPFFGVLALGVAQVAVGIARAAVDQAIAVARTKQPLGSKRSLAQREVVQYDLARAEAKVRAARALISDALGEAEREVEAKGQVSLATRAHVRLAACHVAHEAQEAVDIAYETGGASGVYAKNPLQRHFRDVHVATQHLMVSKTSATLAGRVLLGLEVDTSTL
jgi:alkylation response protein AidB-like acyl-CoA dehydrogenase